MPEKPTPVDGAPDQVDQAIAAADQPSLGPLTQARIGLLGRQDRTRS